MTTDNVTPIAAAKRYTLEEARKELVAGFPCDLDAAAIYLSQAAGVLALVTEILDGKGVNFPEPKPLGQAVYAALADVNRAKEALFGPLNAAASEKIDD